MRELRGREARASFSPPIYLQKMLPIDQVNGDGEKGEKNEEAS